MGKHGALRRGARRDAGEAIIIEGLEAAGYSVKPWGTDGACDLVVGKWGINWLLEVKTPRGTKGAVKHQMELNELQAKWHADWKGQKAVVRSLEEALRWASNVDEFKLKVQGISTTADASRDEMARSVTGGGAGPSEISGITRFGG